MKERKATPSVPEGGRPKRGRPPKTAYVSATNASTNPLVGDRWGNAKLFARGPDLVVSGAQHVRLRLARHGSHLDVTLEGSFGWDLTEDAA